MKALAALLFLAPSLALAASPAFLSRAYKLKSWDKGYCPSTLHVSLSGSDFRASLDAPELRLSGLAGSRIGVLGGQYPRVYQFHLEARNITCGEQRFVSCESSEIGVQVAESYELSLSGDGSALRLQHQAGVYAHSLLPDGRSIAVSDCTYAATR